MGKDKAPQSSAGIDQAEQRNGSSSKRSVNDTKDAAASVSQAELDALLAISAGEISPSKPKNEPKPDGR